MKILGPSQSRIEDAQGWAASRGASGLFVALAELYWRYAPERGVRPEVAYAQSAKETAFGNYGGVVDPSFRNPCGLKTAEATGDAPSDHQVFPTWEVGIQAHLDHLALYAGALGYPLTDTPDPRHFAFLFGTAPRVEALGSSWAPAPDYGTSLILSYVKPLLAFESPAPAPVPPYATVDELHAVGLDLEEAKRVLGEVHRAVYDAGLRLTQTV